MTQQDDHDAARTATGHAAADLTVEVVTVAELAERLELQTVTTLELHAVGLEQVQADRTPEFRIATAEHLQPQMQQVRFRMETSTPDADYTVVVAVVHTSPHPIEIPRPVWRDYVEQVSFMIAFPYLRESVAGLAARLGRTVPTLPIMQRGMFQLPPDETPASPEPPTAPQVAAD